MSLLRGPLKTTWCLGRGSKHTIGSTNLVSIKYWCSIGLVPVQYKLVESRLIQGRQLNWFFFIDDPVNRIKCSPIIRYHQQKIQNRNEAYFESDFLTLKENNPIVRVQFECSTCPNHRLFFENFRIRIVLFLDFFRYNDLFYAEFKFSDHDSSAFE